MERETPHPSHGGRLPDPLVDEIVNRVRTVTEPERIILFGSAAKGQMASDSDIDLLVLEAAVHDPREEQRRIRQALRGLGFPVDVLIMSAGRFEETKDVIGGMAYPAHKYGRVLYAST